MLAATVFPPLLVNLESMTSKPNAVGGSKKCVTWKVEEAVHYFVHADKATEDSFTDNRKEPQPQEGGLIYRILREVSLPA